MDNFFVVVLVELQAALRNHNSSHLPEALYHMSCSVIEDNRSCQVELRDYQYNSFLLRLVH